MTFFEMISVMPGIKFGRTSQRKTYQWEPGVAGFMVDETGNTVQLRKELFEAQDWQIMCDHPQKLWEPTASREFEFGWGIICRGCNQRLRLVDPKVEALPPLPTPPPFNKKQLDAQGT